LACVVHRERCTPVRKTSTNRTKLFLLGETVSFRVRIEDNGEAGVLDRFGIRLSNLYYVPTRLLGDGGPGGGNVQLHKNNPSTTGPNPSPDEVTMCGDLLTP